MPTPGRRAATVGGRELPRTVGRVASGRRHRARGHLPHRIVDPLRRAGRIRRRRFRALRVVDPRGLPRRAAALPLGFHRELLRDRRTAADHDRVGLDGGRPRRSRARPGARGARVPDRPGLRRPVPDPLHAGCPAGALLPRAGRVRRAGRATDRRRGRRVHAQLRPGQPARPPGVLGHPRCDRGHFDGEDPRTREELRWTPPPPG
ncbi:hypothetical protein Ae168Ps1_5908 [Pseudonocardia sp. Ae168_Ps1]|nr:hypothetical protein Ae168Ps1_5908 [Pseudonocardia sp. Ae168_Ps1]